MNKVVMEIEWNSEGLTGGHESEQLRAQQMNLERFRVLIENSQDLVVEVTTAGEILHISPNVRDVLGFEPREMVGTKLFERIHPDDLADMLAGFPLPHAQATFRYRRKDDSWRWLETSGRDFLSPCGETRGVLIARDVTDRMNAEIALRENQRVLATLFSNLPGMAYRCANNRDWRMEFVSDACRELTGYSAEDLIGNRGVSYGEIIAPYDRHFVWEEIQTAVKAQKPFLIQYRIHTADGVEKWVCERGQGIFGPDSEMQAIEGFVTDITERKLAEQALLESEEKFSKAFHACPDAVGISEIAPQRFIEVNEGYCRIFGFAHDEFIGRSALELGLWDNKEDWQRCLDAFSAAGSIRDWELIARKKSGERIICLLSAELIELRGRKCIVSALRDITAQRQAESERLRLEAQLRQAQKLEAIGSLAGGVAHDFNNILGAIMAYSELAQMEADAAQSQKYLKEVHKACERGRELVRQILTFTRQQKHVRSPFHLQLVVDETLKLLRPTIPSRIEVETQIATDTPAVMADPTQIHQILMNLCTNAVHAMKESAGKLKITLNRRSADQQTCQAHTGLRPGEYVYLTVSDTGHGMGPETLKRIFEPFFTTKAPGGGCGLGLAVVRGIVRDHDGVMTVQSTAGAGTTFHIFFPVAPIQPNTVPAQPPKFPRGNGEHILLVDDETSLCATTRAILERLGYRVTSFTNPVEALQTFQSAPDDFQMVLTDRNMPQLNGLGLAREILNVRPQMPVLLMSGFHSEPHETGDKPGIRDIVMKPMSMADVANAVAKGFSPHARDNHS